MEDEKYEGVVNGTEVVPDEERGLQPSQNRGDSFNVKEPNGGNLVIPEGKSLSNDEPPRATDPNKEEVGEER